MVKQQKPKTLDQELGSIPEEFLKLDISHYSPTQLNQPLWLWALMYGAFTQKERRRNKTNVNMFFGTCIGGITQMMFCDEIWTYQSNKVENNNKISMDQALEILNTDIRAYEPWDEKDREKYEAIRHLAPDYLKQSYEGWKSLNFKAPVIAERNVTNNFTYVNGLGRIDGEDDLHFVEQKCKLPRLLKPKKDGTRSVSSGKIDISIQHCRQTAFYYAATKKRPFLLYVNDQEYKIFDSSNCDLLTKDAMAEHMEYYKQQARLRDRHIINSKGDLLKLLSFHDPDWESFYADIGDENLKKAQDLFKQAHNL